ncbi:MAG: hypothetical protein DRI36_05735, partial [Caldiserica bacterium]
AIRKDLLFNIFNLRIGISNDVLKTYEFYDENKDELENFDELSSERQQELTNEIIDRITHYRNRITLNVPDFCFVPKSGFINIGFGLFAGGDFGLKFKKGILVPKIQFWGSADAIAMIPVSMKIPTPILPGKIAASITPKLVYRASIDDELTVLEFENYDFDLQPGKGIGFDLSFIWELNDRLRIGGVLHDFTRTKISYEEVKDGTTTVKSAYSSYINPDLSIGIAYKPKRIYYWIGKSVSFPQFITLLVDVRNIFYKKEPFYEATFFKKLHLGAEADLKILKLRGGFYQGYPSFGLGLDLWFLEIDYAFWGRELGRYPGQIPEWNHMISIRLSF